LAGFIGGGGDAVTRTPTRVGFSVKHNDDDHSPELGKTQRERENKCEKEKNVTKIKQKKKRTIKLNKTKELIKIGRIGD
jgi:hypothetical protein